MQLPREHGPIAETAWLTPTRIVCVLPSRPPSAILVRAARHASAVRCGEDVLRGSLRSRAASWDEKGTDHGDI